MTPRIPALPLLASRASGHPEDLPPPSADRGWLFAVITVLFASAAIAVIWLASTAVLDCLGDLTAWLRDHDNATAHVIATLVLLLLAVVVCSTARSRAIAPGRPVRVDGGRGTIPVDEIGAWLRDAIQVRTDVREAQVTVEHRGKGVHVVARIAVTPDARLADTARGARACIEEVLMTQVGVPLTATPSIELRYEELRLRPQARSQAQESNA